MKTTLNWVNANPILLLLFGLLGATVAVADDIPLDQLPKTVQKSVQDRFPGARIISAETETDNGELKYEVKIQSGDQQKDISVQPDGSIVDVEDE